MSLRWHGPVFTEKAMNKKLPLKLNMLDENGMRIMQMLLATSEKRGRLSSIVYSSYAKPVNIAGLQFYYVFQVARSEL